MNPNGIALCCTAQYGHAADVRKAVIRGLRWMEVPMGKPLGVCWRHASSAVDERAASAIRSRPRRNKRFLQPLEPVIDGSPVQPAVLKRLEVHTARGLGITGGVFVGHSVRATIGILAAKRAPDYSRRWCSSVRRRATSATTVTWAGWTLLVVHDR